MSNPTSQTQPRRPSKPLHDMDEDERLEALKAWAEEKKYVYPGEGGTLATGGLGGVRSLAFGGPLPTVVSDRQTSRDKWAGQYEAPVGPPGYEVATSQQEPPRRKSFVKRWMENRKAKKEAQGESAPPYTP